MNTSRLRGSAQNRATRFITSRAGLLTVTAAAAAATAAWVDAQGRRAERDNPPTGQFLDIDGVRLHYLVRGEGPPVVLLHGNNAMLTDFNASGLMERLARHHRVIAFDRPGFGHSTRPRDRLWTPSAQAALLHAALARLGIERPVVVGHSMGTLVALALALDYPASVRSLVLLGGYYYPSLRVDALLAAPAALPVVGDVMRYTVTALSARALLKPMLKSMFAPDEVPSSFLAALPREMLLRPAQLGADAEDAAFLMPAARSLSSRYHELHLPITLVAGTDDQVVDPKKHSQRLHSELPHSELINIPGAGHMVHYRAQNLIAGAIDGPVPAQAPGHAEHPAPASPDVPAPQASETALTP